MVAGGRLRPRRLHRPPKPRGERHAGCPATHRWRVEHGDPPPKPGYATTAVGMSHCGASARWGY